MGRKIKTTNLALLYQKAAEKYEELPAFATRQSALQWNPVSYRSLYEQGLDLATGLIELGLQARDHVGLFSDNRFEWILSDCAVQLAGAADVPRGIDVSDEELLYIVNHAGIKLCFVETADLMHRLLALKEQLPELETIILMNPDAKPAEGVYKLGDIKKSGAELRAKGDKRVEERIGGVSSDDLFTLIYTSGTTGRPKGVMLTHANMMSQIRNIPGFHHTTDRVLSVLPIWHIFERVIEMYTLSFGGCTYYSSIRNLGEDMRNVEPTFMASAPRLWEKLHERITKNIKASHPMRQILFYIAYFLARQYKDSLYFIFDKQLKMKEPKSWKRMLFMPFQVLRWLIVLPWYGFFNAAVLERIRLGAGGSLSATISGGGALPLHIDRFFNYVGIPVLEGYGMTETSPVISVRFINNLVVGTVGPPLRETELRIVEPESGKILYPNTELPGKGVGQRGEIWMKGPQLMRGYYKEPELTKKTVVSGWLRTGDLGAITWNNCLKILGRSKSTIVLSGGENVEPEPIEMRLQQSPFIEYSMLVGQDKRFICALIVPSLQEFRAAGFKELSLDVLAENPEAQIIIKKEIQKMTARTHGFKKYEQIRDFRMLPDIFRVGDELTNLYKIKRHIVTQKYQPVIDAIFAKETPNS